MIETLSILGGIAIVHLLAISSPGPTFIVVTRYAAAGDRTSGLLVALGVCLATLTWASFAAAGLGALVAKYPTGYAVLQYAGAAYLIWLGAKLLWGFFKPGAAADSTGGGEPGRPAGGWNAVAAGFLTNISNPKVIAYYTSLFGVMAPANPSQGLFLAIVATVLLVSLLWWTGVALFFSIPAVHRAFLRVRRYLDAAMGGLLVAIGVRLVALR